MAAKTEGNEKKVSEVSVGEAVRPENNWEAYNASISAKLELNTEKTYKVTRELEDGWLGLEPDKKQFMTTIVFVHFKDPNRVVKTS